MGLDYAEPAGGTNRRLTEATLFQQKAILLFCPLTTARATKHIQVAHRMCFIDVVRRWPFRHHPLHQQQSPVFWKGFATISQDHAAALIVPVVNNALEDDGIGDGRNCFKEVAGKKRRTISNSHALEDVRSLYRRISADQTQCREDGDILL